MADEPLSSLPIISKAEARASGLRKYFTGKPCPRGHIAERDMEGACTECKRNYQREYQRRRFADPAKRAKKNAYYRAYAYTPKVGVQRRKYRLAVRVALAGRPKPAECEVCGRGDQKIHFDHCHRTGMFRGWLCSCCNLTVGRMKDDPELLRKLAIYTERHNAVTAQGDWVAKEAMERRLGKRTGYGSQIPAADKSRSDRPVDAGGSQPSGS